jgi:hypothetical protein
MLEEYDRILLWSIWSSSYSKRIKNRLFFWVSYWTNIIDLFPANYLQTHRLQSYSNYASYKSTLNVNGELKFIRSNKKKWINKRKTNKNPIQSILINNKKTNKSILYGYALLFKGSLHDYQILKKL